MNDLRVYTNVLRKSSVLGIVLSVFFTSCNPSTTIESPVPFIPTADPATATPEILPTDTAMPEPTEEPTPTSIPQPQCMQETFPPGYESSYAVEGFKLFTSKSGIKPRYIYFSPSCSLESIEHDVNLLFYGDMIADDEAAFMLLEPFWEGTLGTLYGHLAWYEFWAMGPEDYPSILEDRGMPMETNIIIFRVDKMNGEGNEGNSLLTLMEGMGEHEYIHTVQGRNNPNLSKMIWSDGYYRAFIERYANLGNNIGQWYYRAAPTMLLLLQLLDDLNSQGVLEEKVITALAEQNMDLNAFINRDVPMYTLHIQRQLLNVTGSSTYAEKLSSGTISPLLLLNMAGCGDLVAYEVVRKLYNENVADYNVRFYASDTANYLPATFEQLFDPN